MKRWALPFILAVAFPILGHGVELFDFDIPQGYVKVTLIEWSHQAHMQALFDSVQTGGKITNAVKGWYSAKAALDIMVEGTSIDYDFINYRTIAVMPRALYCKPELGANAPLPPCTNQPPLEIRGQ